MKTNFMPGRAGLSMVGIGAFKRTFRNGLLATSAMAMLCLPMVAQAQGFGESGGSGTFNLVDWAVDRYAPNGWNPGSTDPLGGSALKISISNADRADLRTGGLSDPFYNYQGRIRASGGSTEIGGEFYIPASWGTPGNLRSTSLWSRDTNPVEGLSFYPIMSFINNDPADAFNPLAPSFQPRFRIWSSYSGVWNTIVTPILWNQYNSFRIVDTGSSFQFYINGALVQTDSGVNYSDPGWGGLSKVFLNTYNFGNASNSGTLPDSSYDVYWKNVYAITSNIKGTPVDLNGNYQAAGSYYDQINDIYYDGSASATTNPAGDRRSSGQVFEESQAVPSLEGTLTPFSDANKAPTPMSGLDLRGKSYSAEVNLGDVEGWTDPDAGFGGEWFQLGLGSQALAEGETEESFVFIYRNVDKFSFYYNTDWYSYAQSPAHQYDADPSATKFRLKVDINAAGTEATLTVTPLDGPDAFNAVTLLPAALDTVNDNVSSASFFAGFTTNGYGMETGRVVVSNFKTDATANTQYVFAADPYNLPMESVSFEMGQANLQAPVGGFMAFLQSTGTLGFGSGSYTNYPYPAGHFFNAGAVTASGELSGGIAVNAPLVQDDYSLANILLTGIHGASGYLSIKPNNGGGLDSQFSDGDGNPILADRRRSNVAMFDNVAPTIGAVSATQVGNVNSPNPVVTGMLSISFAASDAFTGLHAQPSVTIDFAPIGAGPEDVSLHSYAMDGNVFGAQYDVPNTAPNGAGQIVVTAVDRAGNSVTQNVPLNVNTATLTLNLQLEYYLSLVNVTRGIEITLGGSGGPNAPISFDRDVVFNTAGAATVVLDANDGLPNTSGASYQLSAKDPAHTLRRTVAVSGVGNQYTATASLKGGNINRDNKVDIGDYVVYAMKFGFPVSPDTPFPQAPTFRHADISGDGIAPDGKVDAVDFSFINSNFAQFDDALVGNFSRPDTRIRTRISVADAIREAGNDKNVIRLDLNRDGTITLQEIQLFLQGGRVSR